MTNSPKDATDMKDASRLKAAYAVDTESEIDMKDTAVMTVSSTKPADDNCADDGLSFAP